MTAGADLRPSDRDAHHHATGDHRDRPTISAIEMSRLCGVGRERLRTWERRHGFPDPVRAGNGVRRYHPEDVRKVVAVARMVDAGMPLADAIARAHAGAHEPEDALDVVEGSMQEAAAPMIAVAGPEPLTVAWTNAETAKLPEGPRPGQSLLQAVPHFGAAGISQMQRLLAGVGPECLMIEHGDWLSSFPAMRRSLAWRVPPQTNPAPLAVLVQLPQHDDRLTDAIEEADGRVWGEAFAEAAEVLREDAGLASLQRALGEFVRRSGAIDGFLAVATPDGLRAASSVRGLFAAGPLSIEPNDHRLAPLRSPSIGWLPDGTCRALGAMPSTALLMVPMIAGGAGIGTIVLAYQRELPLGDRAREQLSALALLLGMALQRERLRAPAARH